MKRIALYGYGTYGKRASESFRFFWRGDPAVTAIFDRDRAGERDAYLDLTVLPPDRLEEEYIRGTFEAVMICIFDGEERLSVKKLLWDLGIPLFLPGKEEDIAGPEAFTEVSDPGISVERDRYSFHIYRDMMAAAADFERTQVIFLFDPKTGRVNIDGYKKYRHWYGEILFQYPFPFRDPVPEKIVLKGDWCILAKPYAFNYGHFTFEAADCVYLLEKAGYKGKYLVNERRFTKEVLRLLGVSPERLVSTEELDIHKVYVFERLFSLEHSGFGQMEYSKEVLPEMADLVRKKLTRDLRSPKRIYIRRTGVRKLLNGEAFAGKHGFTVIVPEEHSVVEQMNLFYNADIVLCPHGANSTNFLYMHKGAVFAEVFSGLWNKDINAGICEAGGVHYLKAAGQAPEDGAEDKDADYTVPEADLRNLVRKAEMLLAAGPERSDIH